MAEEGFNLQKWASNSSELMARIVNAEVKSCADAITDQSS